MATFTERYETYRQAVEAYLDGLYAGKPHWADLYEAVRYSLLAGGKRIRPVLALEFARLSGLDWRSALPAACAVELIHTASLIHDDLPCMDDDDFRRGRPTSHRAFGETMAVLAADTLMLDAFGLIAAAPDLTAAARADCVAILSAASGCDGMVGGQVLDTLHAPGTEEALTEVHRMKTGAMIAGACEIGAAAGGGALRDAARQYGYQLGMAFQIRDDMLDVIGDAEEFGKPIGSDREEGKVTFVDLLGLEGCEQRVQSCTKEAIEAVSAADRDSFLRELAQTLTNRTK